AVTVVAVGDVNGDARPDVAVLVYPPSRASGQVALYFGGASGTSPHAGRVVPEREPRNTPAAVAAGDLDGDRAPELIVGEADARGGRGAISVFRGGAAGPATVATVTLDGPKPDSHFGAALAAC